MWHLIVKAFAKAVRSIYPTVAKNISYVQKNKQKPREFFIVKTYF